MMMPLLLIILSDKRYIMGYGSITS